MYAMKYMNKAVCIEKDAVRNVLREMDILMGLDHSFLVNLWFTFQDEEDLFVVVDLLLGGDFRYHLQQGTKFSEDVVRFYVGEIAMALEYLRTHRIIHRDIKPDNLLLDCKGHVHLTDFNVATVMEDENTLATSMSGTKPYMAPEIFKTSAGKLRGYSHEVDWWSLGISIFEILRGKRPYHISSNTNLPDIIQMFESSCLMFPSSWSKNFRNLVKKLLHIDPKIRLDSVEKLKECELMQSLNWESLYRKEITIPFIPSKDHLNCDPTYELEEMIIEPNPLHKKKKRLAKQNSNKVDTGNVQLTPLQMKLDTLSKKFKPFNRERFIHEAPLMALSGTKYDTKPPPKSPCVPKGQKRALVGLTNRWRLPENVASDLLGSSQAMKSVFVPYNETLVPIKTAGSARISFNHTAPHLSRSSHRDFGLNDEFRKGSRQHLQTAPDILNCEHQNSRWQPNYHAPNQPKTSDLKTQVQQVRFNKSIPPLSAQEPTPMELFLYHSQAATFARGPDVILYALGTAWELHKPYFQKSGLLRRMVKEATEQSLVTEMMSDNDNETSEKQAPSRSAVDLHAVKSAVGVTVPREEETSALKLIRTPSFGHAMVLKLKVKDPLLTKQAFALALGSLYVDQVKMDDTDVVGVLAAASLLEYGELKKACVDVMLGTISVSTVCAYHSVATKYKQITVIDACERWLELNLVPQLSLQIYLSHLRQDVLEKSLKSSRLFTWNEYSLYKVLAYWIFLHQHPKIRVMPSWSSVVTWFMSLPKTSAFLDRAEGQGYTSLLRSLRLISITDSIHLDEIHKMNIIPQSWLLHIYSQNYHALQGGGGDMSLLTKFDQGAVRVGFILDQNLQYHSSMLSLHGFHFELKAAQEEYGRHLFYLQRLRPNDPMSFRTTERQTFSLRQDREVRYSIRVQWEADNTTQVYSSGIMSQAFGFNEKTNRSEVITLRELPSPIYVTFSVMFPTS